MASKKALKAKIRAPRWELVLPRRLVRWVPSTPWLTVRPGDAVSIGPRGRSIKLSLMELVSWTSDEQLEDLGNSILQLPGPHLIAKASLKRSVREGLERRGVSYVDAQGHLHLVAPGLLVHLDEPTPAPAKAEREAGTLGVHGVRAVQSLLEHSGSISLTVLAKRARLSLGQTHAVLRILERAGLLRTTGSGPNTRRMVNDRGELLDWLARQPAARRREKSVDAALYARTPEELWTAVTRGLDRAGIPHALTGAAAASRLGVGPTSVPVSRVRINPEVPLEAALTALGTERTDRAPNLRLVRDTGEVGGVGSELQRGARLAPKVRVYLDCLAERRGEDIAAQFRATILAY